MRLFKQCVLIYLGVVVTLAPVKFGTILYTGTAGSFPMTPMEWLFMSWPPALAPLFSGIALLATIAAFPLPPTRFSNFFRSPWLLPALWGTLVVGGIPGLLSTTEWNRGLLFLGNLLSAFALSAAVLIVVFNHPRVRTLFLTAILFGTSLAVADGWYEIKGGGLKATLEHAQQEAAARDATLDPAMRNRLTEGRASGTFFYPNSFAAHLVLTLPVCLAAIWIWGGRVHPPSLSRILFITTATGLAGTALVWSGSRAALVALGGGLIFAAMFTKLPRKWRVSIAVTTIALVGAGLIAANQGRSLSSLEARFNYWSAAVDMAVKHPLTGVGLGEFFPEFARRLKPGQELTRVPHNFWLLFAAECGFPGAVAASLFITLPALLSRGSDKQHPHGHEPRLLLFALRTGLMAWILHSLTDMNFHVPGTMITAAILPCLAIQSAAQQTGDKANNSTRTGLIIVRILLVAVGILSICGAWRLPGDLAMQRLIAATREEHVHTSELQDLAATAARRLPSSPYPWLVLARAAEQNGQLDTAVKALREALARTPHRGAVWAHLAILEKQRGNSNAANTAVKKAKHWSGKLRAQ